MKNNIKFYKCPKCGNIIQIIDGDINNITCCGKVMEEMQASMQDGAIEKHIPVYEKVEDELFVKVGEVEHPMEKDHYIMWIALVVENRIVNVKLYPEQAPNTRLPYIKGATIYAYCNKHGLWKTIVE